jgi:hypothetical protein
MGPLTFLTSEELTMLLSIFSDKSRFIDAILLSFPEATRIISGSQLFVLHCMRSRCCSKFV